jgi:glycosyltransferase involved in cell wall biosynthesis
MDMLKAMLDTGKQPLVSVVIPNFNYGDYLEQCLSSVLNQTYPKIEVIVVDDGSTDDSFKILQKYEGLIRVINQTNSGVNAARNAGIRKAKGEYIAFCDSDDFWEKDKIEKQVAKLGSHWRVGLVYSGYRLIIESDKTSFVRRGAFRGKVKDEFIKYPTLAIVIGGGSTAILKREVFDCGVYFDETLLGNGEDWDFFRRVAQLTEFDFIDEPLVSVRRHESSRGSRSLNHFYLGNLASIEKALLDKSYEWNFHKRWGFVLRFEWMIAKSFLRERDFVNSILHAIRGIIPLKLLRLKLLKVN